jgi:4-amino-4-deoxy-L-arabinose transferase-like glycosyltransferase
MTTRSRALLLLMTITAIGGVLRFYNLAWGAPYHPFHPDEHAVFVGADLLRSSPRIAALSGKFFMYGPLPMYLVNVARWVYETLAHPLVLTVHQDAITYMVLGRAISAAFGTATIPVIYAVAARVAGRPAGLFAAAFLAFSVLPIRDSHFLSVDMSLTFFCTLTWLALLRMAERGSVRAGIAAGMAFAAALTCSYTAAFMAVPIALAHLMSPGRPRSARPAGAWGRWLLRGLVPAAACLVTFLLLDPMAWLYFDKFLFDVRTQVGEPLTAAARPIAVAHFADLTYPRLYWFTNLLWWGMGPALEIASLLGLVWLLTRRNHTALLAAAVPIAYFAMAGSSPTPFMRNAIPLVTALTVAAGALSAELLRLPRRRLAGALVTLLVLAPTAAYAAAYMNIFRQPDSRIEAARYLRQALPTGARVLVEPSPNTPPIGSYLFATNFYRDYAVRGPNEERLDFLRLYGLDTHRYLYDRRHSDAEKRAYIASRLVRVDWIVIDDTYAQRYEHLPEADHGVVKQHYRDLFAGRLDFNLDRTFKVYPSLFGFEINDDGAELSFRSFDHPRVFVFKRRT